jgi:cell growth-regulating nucleolar protein
MVSFICNHCQDTIKKPKLDKHAAQCPNASFTCIDCNKDFPGTSYRTHTSCISEAEKYQKGLYKDPKVEGRKKRERAEQRRAKQALTEQQRQATIIQDLTNVEAKKRSSEEEQPEATKKAKTVELSTLIQELMKEEKKLSLKSFQKKLAKKYAQAASIDKETARERIAKEVSMHTEYVDAFQTNISHVLDYPNLDR